MDRRRYALYRDLHLPVSTLEKFVTNTAILINKEDSMKRFIICALLSLCLGQSHASDPIGNKEPYFDRWRCPNAQCPVPYTACWSNKRCECKKCDRDHTMILLDCPPFDEPANRCIDCGYTEFWFETMHRIGRKDDKGRKDEITTAKTLYSYYIDIDPYTRRHWEYPPLKPRKRKPFRLY